jgi:recombination protein RecT
VTDIIKATENLSISGIDPKNEYEKILIDRWDRLEMLMPAHVTQKKVFQVLSSTINNNPQLLVCSTRSVLESVMRCVALGLTPSDIDGLGQCWIIPYGKTATFVMGYKGALELARRSGQIRDVKTSAVYVGEAFSHTAGSNESISHIPNYTLDRSAEMLTHVYVIVRLVNGGIHMEVMGKSEIDAIRNASQAYKYATSKGIKNTPWVTDYEAMARKTIINRIKPYLPMTPEIRTFWRDEEESAVKENPFNNFFANRPQTTFVDAEVIGGELETEDE